ncbi:hypothetical protein Dimus_005462, partial [Dionaea muscipula]
GPFSLSSLFLLSSFAKANRTCVSNGKEERAVNSISYYPSRHLRASPTSISSSPSSSPVLNRAIFGSQSLNSIDEGKHRDSDDIEVFTYVGSNGDSWNSSAIVALRSIRNYPYIYAFYSSGAISLYRSSFNSSH